MGGVEEFPVIEFIVERQRGEVVGLERREAVEVGMKNNQVFADRRNRGGESVNCFCPGLADQKIGIAGQD